MGTTIQPQLSAKNKYWIERHRYYELKHFCLQYPLWKKAYSEIDGFSKDSASVIKVAKMGTIHNPTEKYAEEKIVYLDKIWLIEKVAFDTDSELHNYILKAVTEGLSYDYLKSKLEIPCCKDIYYDLYRKFFWSLDKSRN
ncbi:hypothetical protein FACS1894132_04710 [Clostridia bacterium]|nr:hypothetical protein FACS1894132_04710 [Clostridia bacterium]